MSYSRRRGARSVSMLQGEHGTIHREAGSVVALGYPASYRVGASSLGAQTVYRTLNTVAGLACTRFFTPEKGPVPRPLITLETGRPVSESAAIAFSIACETELLQVVALLSAAGLEPLSKNRDDGNAETT